MYRAFESSHARETESGDWTHALTFHQNGHMATRHYAVEHATSFWRALFEHMDTIAKEPDQPVDWTISERIGALGPAVFDVALRFPPSLTEKQENTLIEALGDAESDTVSMFLTHLLNGLEETLATTLRMPEQFDDHAWKSLVFLSELARGPDEGLLLMARIQWPQCRVQPSVYPLLREKAVMCLNARNVFACLPSMPIDALKDAIACPVDRLSIHGLPLTHPLIPLGGLLNPVAIGNAAEGGIVSFDEEWRDRYTTLETRKLDCAAWSAVFPATDHYESRPVDAFRKYVDRHADRLTWVASVEYGKPFETPRQFEGKAERIQKSTSRSSSRASTPGVRRVTSAPNSRAGSASGSNIPLDPSVWIRASALPTFNEDLTRTGAMQAASVMAQLDADDKKKRAGRKSAQPPRAGVQVKTAGRNGRVTATPPLRSPAPAPAPPPPPREFNSDDEDDEDPEDGFSLTSGGTRATGSSYNTVSTSRPYKDLEQSYRDRPEMLNLPSPEECTRFFEMIRPIRVKNTSEFNDIMAAWYDTTGGSNEGLNKLLAFVRKGQGTQNLDDLSTLWRSKSLERSGKTCRTLAFFAREDAPTEYEQWHKQWMEEAYVIAMSTTHFDVAMAFYRRHWLDMMVNPAKDKPVWYFFRDHRLEQISTNEVMGHYMAFVHHCDQKYVQTYLRVEELDQHDALSEDQRETTEKMGRWVAKFQNVVKNLKNNGFSKHIIGMSASMFSRPDFDTFADANPGLKACRNGVVVCDAEHAYVRQGRIEDFCTMKMDFMYRPEYTEEHPKVKQLLEFYHKLFCDPELEAYMRRDFASYLISANLEKLFRCWIGDKANNGKSTLAGFISSVLCDYACPLTVSMYTGRDTAAESSMPQLKSTRNCAVAFMSETKEGQELNENRVKEHTGNDNVAYRGHHEEMQRMRITFKLIMHTNFYPQLTNGGAGMILRALFVKFLSEFVDDAPAEEEEQYRTRRFPNDLNFSAKLEGLKDAFGWLIVNDFAAYRKRGIKVLPDCLRKAKEEYWANENFWGLYVSECIEPAEVFDAASGKPTRDPAQSIEITQILTNIKAWITTSNVHIYRQPSKKLAITYMTRLLGAPVQTGTKYTWHGYRFTME